MSDSKESCRVLAVDFGGSRIKEWRGVGTVDNIEETAAISNQHYFVDLLHKRLQLFNNAAGVAVALPMTIRYSRGQRRFAEFQTKYKWWAGKSVRDVEVYLTKALHVPAFIDQDGRLCALYQAAEGPAKDFNSSLTVAIGTSISGGFVFLGKVFQGQMTSQLSHMVVHPNGDACGGHKGCLKTLVGKDAREKLSCDLSLPMDSKGVYDPARDNNKAAIEFFNTLAERLADALAKILRALPVECVVIAGGVAKAGDFLLVPLRNSLASKLDAEFNFKVKKSSEKEPVVKGAAIYGRERLTSRIAALGRPGE